MPYEQIAVRQAVPFEFLAEDGTVTVNMGSVLAGSALVVVGGTIKDDGVSTAACLLTGVSDTSSNTWGSVTNRAFISWAPNAFAAIASNVAAGTPTVTLSFGSSSDNIGGGVVYEITDAAAAALEVVKSGVANGTASTSTDATGTLSQDLTLALLACTGWYGTPTNPTGWTQRLTRKNGLDGYLGLHVCDRLIEATTSFQGTVGHQVGSQTAAIMVVVKAAPLSGGTTLRYRFSGFNPAVLNSSDTGIEAHVWRNGAPYNKVCERYTGLAATDGGEIIIDTGLPATAAVGDSVTAIFFNGTDFSNYVVGVVEAV